MLPRRWLPLVLLALSGGCVSSSDIDKLSNQIGDVQDQVSALKREASSKEELSRANAKAAQQTEALLRSNAALLVKVDQIDDKLENAQGTIEQTNYRIDRLAQDIARIQRELDELRVTSRATTSPAGSAPPLPEEVVVSAPPTGQDPLQTYQSAFRDYQRGNYDLAIAGFREYLKTNPETDLSDNAMYWIGESLFSQKKYREAIEQFDGVINRFPRSAKISGALLKKGYAYIEVGEKAQGVVQLQYVVHEHPTSQEASLARQKLKSLGIESK